MAGTKIKAPIRLNNPGTPKPVESAPRANSLARVGVPAGRDECPAGRHGKVARIEPARARSVLCAVTVGQESHGSKSVAVRGFLTPTGGHATTEAGESKLRAEQTAKAIAGHIGPPNGVLKDRNLEPLANPRFWTERLNSAQKNIMLVGHLPHLSKLASSLLVGNQEVELIAFRKGGIVCLERSQEDRWNIQWITPPETLTKMSGK